MVTVPVGTSLYRRENRLGIRDLNHEGEEVIVARGGRGGVGNIGDKKATFGEEGELIEIELECLLPSEVFLVGLPNSGKSELLHYLTKANVEGKGYPFSTPSPVMGMYEYDGYKQINICELPSVYEGSTKGHGLGTDFIKHLAKGKVLIYMLDVTLQFSKSLSAGYQTLRKIVCGHDPAFSQLPNAIVVNKIDQSEDPGKVQEEMERLGQLYFLISVKTGEGIESLMDFLKEQTGGGHHA